MFLNETDDDPVYDSDQENDHLYTAEGNDSSSDDDIYNSDDDNIEDIPSRPAAKSKKKEGEKRLPYEPPASLAPVLNDYREQRHEQMKNAFVDDSLEQEVRWTPTDEDMLEIEKSILSR